MFIATSFLEDWLTVGNDKLPGKAHAEEAGFQRHISDTKKTTVPKHCIAGPKKANSSVWRSHPHKFVLEKI